MAFSDKLPLQFIQLAMYP